MSVERSREVSYFIVIHCDTPGCSSECEVNVANPKILVKFARWQANDNGWDCKRGRDICPKCVPDSGRWKKHRGQLRSNYRKRKPEQTQSLSQRESEESEQDG